MNNLHIHYLLAFFYIDNGQREEDFKTFIKRKKEHNDYLPIGESSDRTS